MNGPIVELTFRQLLGKRRSLLMVLFALLPILIAVIYRFAADTDFAVERGEVFSAHQEWAAKVLLGNFVVGSLLPLAALIFGTAALGSEIEDGTAPYLLAKPISRARIVLSKAFVAWVVTAVLVVIVVVAGGLIALAGQPTEITYRSATFDAGSGYGIVAGFGLATIVGALVYTVLFVLLSIATSRAFIVGLIYVFLWEGVVTRLFSGTRVLSVRQYTLGLADGFSNVDANVFDARLGFPAAVILSVVVGALATWYAIRLLERWEIGEAT